MRTNLWICIATFKTLRTTFERHQEDQKHLSQVPFIIRQLEPLQNLRIVVDEAVDCLTEIDSLLKHSVLRIPSWGDIQRNGHRLQAVVFATLAKRLPKQCTFSNRLSDRPDFSESSKERHAIFINEVFEEVFDDEVDNMGDTSDVMLFVIPVNPTVSQQFL
jgi:hypothetical protein